MIKKIHSSSCYEPVWSRWVLCLQTMLMSANVIPMVKGQNNQKMISSSSPRRGKHLHANIITYCIPKEEGMSWGTQKVMKYSKITIFEAKAKWESIWVWRIQNARKRPYCKWVPEFMFRDIRRLPPARKKLKKRGPLRILTEVHTGRQRG